MKSLILVCLLTFSLTGFMKIRDSSGSLSEPWTASQLMAPADLASKLKHPESIRILVYCVGPGALILGSVAMGPAYEKENLEKFKKALEKLPVDTEIVIYCGCCPF